METRLTGDVWSKSSGINRTIVEWKHLCAVFDAIDRASINRTIVEWKQR